MVASLTQGTTNLTFLYDENRDRYSQVQTAGSKTTTTLYLNAGGLLSEKVTSSGTATWHDFIMLDGQIVIDHMTPSAVNDYYVLDNLNSIVANLTGGGSVREALSYDSWGARRNLDGTAATACSITSSSTARGYTNQEEMDSICDVNLNARIYDPVIGRMTTADSMVPDPYDGQSYNRYSYVDNGPLSATDPTGFSAGNVTTVQSATLSEILGNPVTAAIADGCPSCFLSSFTTSSVQSGASTGVGSASGGITEAAAQSTVSPQLQGNFAPNSTAPVAGAGPGQGGGVNATPTVTQSKAGGNVDQDNGSKAASALAGGNDGAPTNKFSQPGGQKPEEVTVWGKLQLTFTTVSGGPGQKSWKVKAQLSARVPSLVSVVQHVVLTQVLVDASGKPTPTTIDYSERWVIDKDEDTVEGNAPSDDCYCFKAPNKSGVVKSSTTATGTTLVYPGLLPGFKVDLKGPTGSLPMMWGSIPADSPAPISDPVVRTDTWNWSADK